MFLSYKNISNFQDMIHCHLKKISRSFEYKNTFKVNILLHLNTENLYIIEEMEVN